MPWKPDSSTLNLFSLVTAFIQEPSGTRHLVKNSSGRWWEPYLRPYRSVHCPGFCSQAMDKSPRDWCWYKHPIQAWVQVLFTLLLIQLFLTHLKKQQKMVQVLGPLLSIWETQMEFSVLGSARPIPSCCGHLKEQVSKWRSLYSSLLQLCFSNKYVNKQTNEWVNRSINL